MVAVNLMVHLGMERCLLDKTSTAASTRPPVVIAGFDESRYTPFLPACRYIVSQDAVCMGKQAGCRIIEKIQNKKVLDSEGGEKNNERIIRLPVTISLAMHKKLKAHN